MATLYEHYEPTTVYFVDINPSQYTAQTFTPSAPHTLTRVDVTLVRAVTGFTPSVYTCTIRATSGSPAKPTTVLDTATFNLTTDPVLLPQIATFAFSGGVMLHLNITYSIDVVSNVEGAGMSWKCIDDITNHYAGGAPFYTNNSGGTWTAWSYSGHTRDCWFQEYGDPLVPDKADGPDPPDGSTMSYKTRYVAWTPPPQIDPIGDDQGYRIYFGTDNPPMNLANGTVINNNGFYPLDSIKHPLDQLVTYYWRIDPYISGVITTGDVWSFATTAEFDETGLTNHEENLVANEYFSSAVEPWPKVGQTFTVSVADSHSVAGVQLRLGRNLRAQPGNINIYIRDTNSGLPTTILSPDSVASYNGNLLPGGVDNSMGAGLDFVYEDIVVEFSNPVPLIAGTQYAITIEADDLLPDFPGNLFIGYSAADVYAGGTEVDNDGASWSIIFDDLFFVEFSEATGLSKPTTPHPLTGSANIDKTLGTITWAQGGGATAYNIYYNFGDSSITDPVFVGSITASDAASPTVGTVETFTIPYIGPSFTSLKYNDNYKWRIDAVNEDDMVTGDTWIFATANFYSPVPPPDPDPNAIWPDPVPDGDDDTIKPGDPLPFGTNAMTVFKRLVAVTNNRFFYEHI